MSPLVPASSHAAGSGGGGGVTELSYVEFSALVTISATTEGAATAIVTAAGITADGSTKYCVELFAAGIFLGASGSPTNLRMILYEAGAAASLGQIGVAAGVGGTPDERPFYARRYLTPAVGTRTYSWRAYRLNADGGAEADVGGAGAVLPGYIRVTSGG